MPANAQETQRSQPVLGWLEGGLEGKPVVPGTTLEAALDNAASNDTFGTSTDYLTAAVQAERMIAGISVGQNRFSRSSGLPLG